MKTFAISILWLLLSLAAVAQDSLSLFRCYELTAENYPLSKTKELNLKAKDLKIENIKTSFLPQLNFTAQATYQSDVIELGDIPIPGVEMPQPTKDQYKVYLDVKQTIYDGGATHARQVLEEKNLEVQNLDIQVQLYQLNERVNSLFFMALLLQKQKKLVELLKDELNKKLRSVESGIENGVLTPENDDVIRAEMLKLDQQLIEIQTGKKACFDMLAELTATEISENTLLSEPQFQISENQTIQRPENWLFAKQQSKLDAYDELLQAARMPKIGAFVQAGIGRPALNMLSDQFEPYYIVGASLSWNIWDWKKNQRERQLIVIQKDMIDNQHQSFNQNIRVSMLSQKAEMEKMEQLIAKDREIIALRGNIKKVYSSQLDNGVITSTEYISEANRETQAKINLEMHKVQLLQAKANYLTTKGKIQ